MSSQSHPSAIAGPRAPRVRRGERADALKVSEMGAGCEQEALRFLSARALHTVILSGMIRDNGLVSPSNRGSFYACRDGAGRLAGVAVVGHLTLFEARRADALAAFARVARASGDKHVIIGEREKIKLFWDHCADEGASPPRVAPQLFYVLGERHGGGGGERESVAGLGPATQERLGRIMEVNAEMSHAACGVNPLESDPEGFRRRTAQRIERGRVWELSSGGRLVFKVDIASETPEAVYIEGLFVAPEERGRGHGLRCLSQFSRAMLGRGKSVCLLVDEGNAAARSLYQRAGFKLYSRYDTLFITPHAEGAHDAPAASPVARGA